MLNGMQAMPNGGEMILAASNGDGRAVIDVIDMGKWDHSRSAGEDFPGVLLHQKRWNRSGSSDGKYHRGARRNVECDQRDGQRLGFLHQIACWLTALTMTSVLTRSIVPEITLYFL